MAADAKTKRTTESVSAFLNNVPDEQRRRDAKTVVKLMEEVTKMKPAMWGTSIVGFGSGDWPIVGLSPRKENLVLYIMPNFDERAALLAKLGKHKTGKTCVYVRSMDDIDVPTLKMLIKKSIAHTGAKE